MTQQSTTPANASKQKKPRRFLRFLGWSLVVLLVLALAAGGFAWFTIQRSFPQTTGTITASGLEHEVTVQRDASGIPTITAATSHDLFFAQGIVHAQDRFWEMDFRRHLTAGRLSELFGESQLGTDKFLRSLGWHDIAAEEFDALTPEARSYYEAYAAGVNSYLSEREGASLSLEYAVLGLQNADYAPEPWTPVDSIAWFKAMAWDLRTNIEDETERALVAQTLDPELLAELYPGYPFDEHPVIVEKDWARELPAASMQQRGNELATQLQDRVSDLLDGALSSVDELISSQGEGIGSNSWVVAGEHTSTGNPLLANDPHLGASLPSVWTQLQLRCEKLSDDCPFDVAGFSFSGLPGIVIGHNQEVAWGFTNLTTDVADLYVERVDGESYWQDGKQLPLTVRDETIKVAGGEDVQMKVRSTKHGPIVSGLTPDFTSIAETPRVGLGAGTRETIADPTVDSNADVSSLSGEFEVSLRWTALDAGSTGEAIFALNRASNFEDFRAAAELFDVPAQNLIYADVSGNIGYQAPGRLPIRGAGDGWLPQPGWDSAYDWQGFIPFDAQPSLYNPDSGYIVTANNAIVSEDYPYFLSRDWDYGYRAARIVELLEESFEAGPVDASTMADIQMDNQMPAAQSLQAAYRDIVPENTEVARALDGLRNWDGQNDSDSGEAAFANVLWEHVTGLMVGDQAAKISRDDQSRYAKFFENQLADPDAAWWHNAEAGVSSQEELLRLAADQAYTEISQAQGTDQSKWKWGELHAIPLVHGTFGVSGIAAIEWLFNRGPFNVGGGSGVVNATGWGLGEGYATTTVPSMRMVIDTSNWDASTWIHLTGASGHAFHSHYTDQTDDWAKGVQRPWNYTQPSVNDTAKDTLTLVPASAP